MGLFVLETCYILLVVVLPVATLAALLVLWLMPLSLHVQEVMARVCYIADSWASFDVAVVVLLIGIMQFGTLSDFLVLQSDIAVPCMMLKHVTQIDCMQIDMNARPALIILLLAFVCSAVVPKIALKMCATSIFRKHRSMERCTKTREVAPDDAEDVADRYASAFEETRSSCTDDRLV